MSTSASGSACAATMMGVATASASHWRASEVLPLVNTTPPNSPIYQFSNSPTTPLVSIDQKRSLEHVHTAREVQLAALLSRNLDIDRLIQRERALDVQRR